MKDTIYAKLFEPSSRSKQKDFIKHFSGSASTMETDPEEIKTLLKFQRAQNVQDLPSTSKKFKKIFDSCASIHTYFADTDVQAAKIIKQVIKNEKKIFVNNSGTVNELSDPLLNQDIEMVQTYFQDQSIPENRYTSFWQLPDFRFQPAGNWFAIQKRINLCQKIEPSQCYDSSALIGVNSASAEDGTLFLLQHSSNIEQLLQSKQIIFLVGLEKIVQNHEQGAFQTRWAGNFGLPYVLMNLEKTTDQESPNSDGEDIGPFRKTVKHPDITIIILDNGRTKLLNTPFEEVLRCISCRGCIRGCPNYQFFGKSSGRYPQQYLFLYLLGKTHDIDLCSYCNNCSFDCPVGIDLAKMFALAKGKGHSALDKFKNRLMGNPELLANFSKAALPLAEKLARNRAVKVAAEKSLGIHRERPLPVYDKIQVLNPRNPADSSFQKTLIYYPGCWANFFEHDIYNATLKLFDLLGYRLIIPTTTCCGLPLIASGEIACAKKKAIKIVQQLSAADPKADIITTCPSCSLAIKKDYIHLDLPGAENLSKRVFDAQEYLFSVEPIKSGRLKFKRYDAHIGYHLPCHQRVQDIEDNCINALKYIPGLSVEKINRGCCGISGTFGQKKIYYQYSMETGRELFHAIDEHDYTMICTECGPCKMQIVHGTQKKTVHPITILADCAYLNKPKGEEHD